MLLTRFHSRIGTVVDSHFQVSHRFKEVPGTTDSESLPEL